ncbi:MAG: glycosyltransferase [Bacteroidetes bacterium]|nr:glycosyltransferase [Bacteroidota bacterium]
MKELLIISPNFPPINAADMHRVRQSLPYFREMGWNPTVIAVEPQYVEMGQDPWLLETIPDDIEIYRIPAFNTRWTRKFGLGNLGYRSLWYYRKLVKKLMKKKQFDLVYFSTTAFPVMTLGPCWQKKYGIPFIIDMQDPWRNDYYLTVPKDKRPPKFRIAYPMAKYLEAKTMVKVNGIISVSDGYPKTLMERYQNITQEMCTVIPFGGASIDFDVLDKLALENKLFKKDDGNIHTVYIGRGGHDMYFALKSAFLAVKEGLDRNPELYKRIRMYFIGTSYALDGKGIKTIEPIAGEVGIPNLVQEITDRLPYFEAMNVLREADMVFIPGSTDAQYTASKLYPYILSKRPLLAVFDGSSSVVEILGRTRAGECVTFTAGDTPEKVSRDVLEALNHILEKLPFTPDTNWKEFEPYSAREMTRRQVEFFEKTLTAWQKR